MASCPTEREPLLGRGRSLPDRRSFLPLGSSPADRRSLLPISEAPKRGRTISECPRRIPINEPNQDEVQRERTFSPTDIEVDLEGWQGSCLCHPQALLHRMIALILMCLLGFGNYFCFDNPGALQSELKDAMNITTAQFANLYAWYSWPNVVLPIIGGFLMDRVFGIRLGTMLFAFIIILGQIIFSMGGFLDRLWVMEVGRFVFGIGGESLSVAQNTYAVSWFKGKELNMVFGFQLSIARVGSTVNFLVMGPLFQYIKNQTLERDAAMNHSMNLFWEENLFEESYLNGSQELDLIAERDSYGPTVIGWTLLTAGGFCVASFFCSVILAWIDKRRNEILNIVEPGDSGEVVKITDVKDFPLSFWFLCLACLSYYGVIFPFVSLAKDFFKVEFDMDGDSANFITGLIYLVSAPASPLLGLLMDKTGRNISWVVLAIISSIGCICLLAFTSVNPFISISCLGVAYSLLASALWPIAALIIPEYQLGTAYGLMQAIQNLGCALIVMAAGLIADEYGYTWLMLFFLGWLFLSLTSTVCIWFCDCSTTGYLNMSISERQIFDDARQAALDAERARQIDGHRLLSRPRTDANIRNRYLSKIGAHLPAHLGQGRLIVPAHQR